MGMKRVEQCVVCGEYGAARHHLLAKSVYPEYREEEKNLVALCVRHHLTDGAVCAHGMHRDARAGFAGWMKRNRLEQYEWWKEHSRIAIDGEEERSERE